MQDEVFLEPSQKNLLSMIVEASRNVPDNRRESFILNTSMDGSQISHPGVREQFSLNKGDIEVLIHAGLLLGSYSSKGTLRFDIAPKGLRYCERLKLHDTPPFQRIGEEMKSYLVTDAFQGRHQAAYQKWAEADSLLRSSNSEPQLTVIGHLCREAMQEFADSLIKHWQVSKPDSNKANTVARLRAVLDSRKESLGKTETAFLDALLPYWGTVSDLVQRQEHGGQKEGSPLVWEDGRRIVFQTAIVMYEIDRALAR